MMSSRDLSLLRRALRYERDMGEVSCGFFCVCACVRVIGVQAKNPIFFIEKKKLFNRQILSHWDRLPLELRQTIQWMADRQQAHDRLKRGWEKIQCQGFKDVCQFCQVRLQPRDDSDKSCIDLPQQHYEQCNVCFNCLIYYDNESSLTDNQCTWYEAHFPQRSEILGVRWRSEPSSVGATRGISRFGCRFRSRSFIGGHLGLGARRLIWNRLHYYRQSQLVEVFHSHSTGKKRLMRK